MRLAGKRVRAAPRPIHSQDQPSRWSMGRLVFFALLIFCIATGIHWILTRWLQVHAPGLLVGQQVAVESRLVAVIRSVLVEENAIVTAGDPLVQLNDLNLTQQKERQKNQIGTLTVQLETERNRVHAETAESQARIDAELARLDSDWVQLRVRRSVVAAKKSGLVRLQDALRVRVREQQDLVALGALPRASLVKSEMEFVATDAELQPLDHELVGLEQSIASTERRREMLQKRREVVASQIRAASRLGTIAAELQTATDELARLDPLFDECQLRAPVSGVVHRIYKRPGEVARVGELILEVCDPLIPQLEAYFSQPDLAYCIVGTEVDIDFNTGQRGRGRIAELRPRAEPLPPEYRNGFEAKRPTIVAIIRRIGDEPWPDRINVQATVRLSRYRFHFWSSAPAAADDRLTVQDTLVKVIRR